MKSKEHAIMKINWDPSKREWRMAKNMGMARGPGEYPSLTVEKEHYGEFYFVIQSPNNVTFAADPLVQKGTKPTDFDAQIKVIAGQGTDTLHVKSENSSPQGGEYHYALKFSNGSTLDPIITNNGCCRPFYQSDAFLVSGGIMVLAFFAYLVRRLVRERHLG